MSRATLVESHPPSAFSYLSSKDVSSSPSLFPLPPASTASSSKQIDSAASQQTYSQSNDSPNNPGYQQGDILANKKRKFENVEEEEIFSQTADRVASCLALDHFSVSFPDTDTPFVDATDVVRRLLPYHIFQHPLDDLNGVTVDPSGKGKAKATGQDLLREEIAETKFALECFRRRKALQDRFKRVKLRSGKRENPDDQAYFVAQAVLEADRIETTAMNAQLRVARIELDKVQREKRIATSAQRPTVYTQAAYPYTPQYRHYTYPYAQYQSNYQQVYSSYPTPTNSQPMTPITQFQTTSTPTTVMQHSSTQQTDSAITTKAIPVQLPVSSLPALHALGIMPVPATSLPPPDQPQPQAVLRGTTSNGTMLSLEINLNLLQTTQTSGLALILNSLTSASASATLCSTSSAANTNK